MHFTSPIRRYPDDICHRQLTAALELEFEYKQKHADNILQQFKENKISRAEALDRLKRVIINGELKDEIGRGHSLRFENSIKLYGVVPQNQMLDPRLTLAAYERYSEMFEDEEVDKLREEAFCTSLEGIKESGQNKTQTKQVSLEDELDERNYSNAALQKISRMKGSPSLILSEVDANSEFDNQAHKRSIERAQEAEQLRQEEKSKKEDPVLTRIIDKVESELKAHGLDIAEMDRLLKLSVRMQKNAAEAEELSTDFFMWKYWTSKFKAEGDQLSGFATFPKSDGTTGLLTVAYVVGLFEKSELTLFSPRLNISYSIKFERIPCTSCYLDIKNTGDGMLYIKGWDIAKGILDKKDVVGDDLEVGDKVKERMESENIKPKTKRSILLTGPTDGDLNDDEEEEEEESEEENRNGKREDTGKKAEDINNSKNENEPEKNPGEPPREVYDAEICIFTPILCEFVLEKEYKVDGMCKFIPFTIQPFLSLTPAAEGEDEGETAKL